MRKIGFFNIGKLGLVKSAGTGKTDINKVIEEWIPKHMVFWYDMSKPADVYTQNFNDWQNYNPNSVSITNNKIVVNGLIDNFRIASIGKETESFSVFIEGLGDKNLVYRVKLDENSNQITNIKLKDGENVLPHSFATTVAFIGVSGVTDYIGLTITQLPSGQSVPTNEILKANPYLQDFSGNNRPLKLNNFLFAAMSGMGGYETNFSDNSIWRNSPQLGNLINNHTYNPMLKGSASGLYTATNLVKIKFKATVTGMKSGYRLEFGSGDIAPSDKSIYEDGEYEFGTGNANVYYGFKLYADDYSNPNTDVIIELKEVYPNALVTDGVDDYGVVENFEALQNYMMFFQCAIIRPNTSKGMFSTKSINNNQGWMLCQNHGKDITRFGNDTYMNFESSTNVEDKTNYILTADGTTMVLRVGDELQPLNGTYSGTGGEMGFFISDYNHTSRFGSMAFYKSILFNAVPTKETDGFTEQDLIDYYIPKAIVTITVVDVSGSPIQDATVTVGGVQYKTLSDGTVKVRGMANGTMSLSVKKDGYMPFSDNSWKLADSRITLEVLRNTVITENGYSILLENDGLILTE